MKPFRRKALGTGHQGKSKKSLENKLGKMLYPCPHDSYCRVKEIRNKDHCSEHYALGCGQPMRFYNRYGEDGNQVGVGS